MTPTEPRPRLVTAAFWLWLLAAIGLILTGLTLILSPAAIPGFFRGAGALWVFSGLAVGFFAGRTRLGDARFRRAAVALSVALVLLLAVFSLMSRGLLWLVIMILLLVASTLILRPVAASWFDPDGPADLDA